MFVLADITQDVKGDHVISHCGGLLGRHNTELASHLRSMSIRIDGIICSKK
jgi:hypothetical protein